VQQQPPAELLSQHRGLWSAAMQPGAVMGEAALLAHTRRTVSVYAGPGSTLLRLTREAHAAAVGCPPPLPVTDAVYRMLKVREVEGAWPSCVRTPVSDPVVPACLVCVLSSVLVCGRVCVSGF
jgi:hypothetical protein